MKKTSLFIICALSIIVLNSCGNKSDGEEKSTELINAESKSWVAENFSGEGNYIIENSVFDYSERFETTYEWTDGVKMPFKKMSNAEISFDEYGNLIIENYTEEDLKEYLKELNTYYAFTEYTQSDIGEKYYVYYGEEILFVFIEEEAKICVYVYTGNVNGKREVSPNDARRLIEDKELLKDKKYFDEYVVIPIENDSVIKNGYYEFVVCTPQIWNPYGEFNDKAYPIYMITDGKNINMFEQNIANIWFPTSMNMVKNKDGNMELIATSIQEPFSSSAFSYKTCITRFVLHDNVFVKNGESTEIENEYVISKLEDGELKFYFLEVDENRIFKKGGREKYIIKYSKE